MRHMIQLSRMLLLLIFLGLQPSTNAQVLGTIKLDTADNAMLVDIVHLKNGGYVTTGTSGYPLFHKYIVKWDEKFNKLWALHITDFNYKYSPGRIIEAPDGSLYYMTLYMSKVTTVVKIKSNGQIQWATNYMEEINPSLYNSLYASAFSNSISDNGYVLGVGECGVSNMVTRADSSGAILWSNQYLLNGHATGFVDGSCTALNMSADGHLCGFMNFDSTLDFNMFLLKLDDKGNILKKMGYKNTETNHSFMPLEIERVNPNMYVILTSNDKSYSSSGISAVGSALLFIDSSLNVIDYMDVYKDNPGFIIKDIAVINNGNGIIATGYLDDSIQQKKIHFCLDANRNLKWGYTSAVHNNKPGVNYRVYSANMTSNTNKVVSLSYGPTHGCLVEMLDNRAAGICEKSTLNMVIQKPKIVTRNPSIAIVAGKTSQLPKATITLYDSVFIPAHIVFCSDTLLPTTSIQNIESAHKLQLFPVPSNDYVIVSGLSTDEGSITYRVNTIDGRTIDEGKVLSSSTQVRINTTELASGSYVITIITKETIEKLRFCVHRN